MGETANQAALSKKDRLTIRRPDDFHVHFRDGELLKAVVPHTARDFARALVMPNLLPPVTDLRHALDYQGRILDALPSGSEFMPLMTLYLTESTSADEIRAAAEHPSLLAVKLYPAGATTHSDAGVHDFNKMSAVFETLSDTGLILCIHGEVVDPAIDIFDREARFIECWLEPIRARFPEMRIVLEHITTLEAVDYVCSADRNLAATITAHHLLITRNDMLVGGIRPHLYCLPVAKRERHRAAVAKAAMSGDRRFFLGTDSAPHVDAAKHNACGCAGIFSAPNALAWVAHAFDHGGALERLETFTSISGAGYYGLAPNAGTVTLARRQSMLPSSIDVGENRLSIFDPGWPCSWSVMQ